MHVSLIWATSLWKRAERVGRQSELQGGNVEEEKRRNVGCEDSKAESIKSKLIDLWLIIENIYNIIEWGEPKHCSPKCLPPFGCQPSWTLHVHWLNHFGTTLQSIHHSKARTSPSLPCSHSWIHLGYQTSTLVEKPKIFNVVEILKVESSK